MKVGERRLFIKIKIKKKKHNNNNNNNNNNLQDILSK
jgi:hypothetical protein